MKKLKILAIVCVLVMATNVHAALQSRPGVDAKKTSNDSSATYFKQIREMEGENGVLGLSAKFEDNTRSSTFIETTEANNIDSHMIKNTEWGAIAMLAVSDYGSGNGNVKNSYETTTKTYGLTASTTGNMTGVFGLYRGPAYRDMIAAGVASAMTDYHKYLLNAPVRYLDRYVLDENKKFIYIPGDGTREMNGFSGYKNDYDFRGTSYGGGFYRGDNGIFSVNALNDRYSGNYDGSSSRACIWVGDGI